MEKNDLLPLLEGCGTISTDLSFETDVRRRRIFDSRQASSIHSGKPRKSYPYRSVVLNVDISGPLGEEG